MFYCCIQCNWTFPEDVYFSSKKLNQFSSVLQLKKPLEIFGLGAMKAV